MTSVEEKSARDDQASASGPSPHPAGSSRTKTWLMAGAVVLGLVLTGLGARWLSQRGGGESRVRPAAAVNVEKATRQDMPVSVTALGTVQPIVTATVRPQLS